MTTILHIKMSVRTKRHVSFAKQYPIQSFLTPSYPSMLKQCLGFTHLQTSERVSHSSLPLFYQKFPHKGICITVRFPLLFLTSNPTCKCLAIFGPKSRVSGKISWDYIFGPTGRICLPQLQSSSYSALRTPFLPLVVICLY